MQINVAEAERILDSKRFSQSAAAARRTFEDKARTGRGMGIAGIVLGAIGVSALAGARGIHGETFRAFRSGEPRSEDAGHTANFLLATGSVLLSAGNPVGTIGAGVHASGDKHLERIESGDLRHVMDEDDLVQLLRDHNAALRESSHGGEEDP